MNKREQAKVGQLSRIYRGKRRVEEEATTTGKREASTEAAR